VSNDRGFSLKRLALQCFAAGLTIAALTAIAALLTGSFDDTEWRVIGTSVAFAVYSSLAAGGAAARTSEDRVVAALGTIALAFAVVAFLLCAAGIWSEPDGGDVLWRSFGCATVIAFATVHGALVLQARSPADSGGVTLIVYLSLGFGALDAVGALIPISGLSEDLGGEYAQLFGVGLVLLILTTALPSVLRRARRAGGGAAAPQPQQPVTERQQASGSPARPELAHDVSAIADRLEALSHVLDGAAPAVRTEVEQLRRVAHSLRD
jgi:hypothetical protein